MSNKDGYKRPVQTYTDKLSNDDIMDKLSGYKKVDDISKVPLGTHLRYFVKLEDGSEKFRMGGFLRNNTGVPKWISLHRSQTEMTKGWTVQLATATIFRKMSQNEIMDEYENKLDTLQKKNDGHKSLNKEFKKENKTLKTELEYYKKENKTLKTELEYYVKKKTRH